MSRWLQFLENDPLPALLEPGSAALQYFVRRDLLDEAAPPVEQLWELPEARKTLGKQQADGSWLRAGTRKHPAICYELVETWRWLRVLVEQYGFNRQHLQIARAVEYIFSCQTQAGDFRGILANQYATYYSGAILGLVIDAGYTQDERVERSFRWLLEIRQDDGGWTIPLLTHRLDRATQYRLTSQQAEPLEPIRSLPFSHNWTGMVLRAFAAHPHYRSSAEAQHAGRLLKSRFFQPDAYTSYQSAAYWVRFEHPFWWNSLLAAMDTLARLGFSAADADIGRGLKWFQEHQAPDGLWALSGGQSAGVEKDTPRRREMRRWVGLAICRVLKYFLG